MSEQNRLGNGRFQHNLNNWTATGNAVYSAGDGDNHYGVAVLPTGGGAIEQTFAVPFARSHSLHIAVKAIGSDLSSNQATAVITNGDGDTVLTQNLSGTADTWTESTYNIGLAPGTTYTLTVTNNSASGDVRIDDIWLWWVPITRANLAAQVHAKLAGLATDASLSTAVNGSLTEGDYTYAIDSGLRSIGAIDPETDTPDTRYLDAALVNAALAAVEREILEQLQRDYAVQVDLKIGPRSEALSQINKALAALTGTGEGQSGGGSQGGPVIVRRLRYE